MNQADQQREEEHFRQVERALLYADDAARKIGEIAGGLKKDSAVPTSRRPLRRLPIRSAPITNG